MKLPRGERRDTARPTRTHENTIIHHRRSSLLSREAEYTFRNGQLIQLHILEKSRRFLQQLATLYLTASVYEDILPMSEPTFVIPQVCN